MLVEADVSVTQNMAEISEAGLRLIDNIPDWALTFSSLDRAHQYVNERNRMNQDSYDAVSEAREAIRKRLGNCATCSGLVNGVCPTFSESEPDVT